MRSLPLRPTFVEDVMRCVALLDGCQDLTAKLFAIKVWLAPPEVADAAVDDLLKASAP